MEEDLKNSHQRVRGISCSCMDTTSTAEIIRALHELERIGTVVIAGISILVFFGAFKAGYSFVGATKI